MGTRLTMLNKMQDVPLANADSHIASKAANNYHRGQIVCLILDVRAGT